LLVVSYIYFNAFESCEATLPRNPAIMTILYVRNFLLALVAANQIATAATSALQLQQTSGSLSNCPGYSASKVHEDGDTITANLKLAGTACNVYGQDLTDLKLLVQYETGKTNESQPLNSADEV
jgi:hypothetical protein